MNTVNLTTCRPYGRVHLATRQYLHVLPMRNFGLLSEVPTPVTRGVSGKATTKVNAKAHRSAFFSPTSRVYGYETEEAFVKHHHDVVNRQRFEETQAGRRVERNQTSGESIIAKVCR